MVILFNNFINFYKNNRINKMFTLIVGGFMSISGQKKKGKLDVP